MSVADDLGRRLLELLDTANPRSGADLARALGRSPRDGSVRRALAALEATGLIVRGLDGFRPVARGANPGARGVLAAVDRLLAGLELDDVGEARAALARALAGKLDDVRDSDAAQAALAVPGISRELREVLDAIQGATDDAREFVSGLFAGVADSATEPAA